MQYFNTIKIIKNIERPEPGCLAPGMSFAMYICPCHLMGLADETLFADAKRLQTLRRRLVVMQLLLCSVIPGVCNCGWLFGRSTFQNYEI